MTTRETAQQSGEHRLHAGADPYPTPSPGQQPDAGIDTGPNGHRAGLDPTASIADPGPLGLAAFAATTFLLSLFNAKIIKNESLETVVLPLALFYGGLAQLLAGMWEFKKANTFGATAFASFGAFWLSFAAYVKFVKPDLPVADAHQATGLFLLVFAIFTTYMFVASLRVSGAIALVFVTLAATFWVLAIGDLSDTENIVKVGGYLGLVTAVAAWYASFATVTNATWKRTLLPTMPAKHT
jgi:succinate-acetate transporter protein